MEPTGSVALSLLIVDDSVEDRGFLRHLIQSAGVRQPVMDFEDGESALAYLSPWLDPAHSAEVPLLMFLDLKLPGMNGHDVIRQVRRQPQLEAMEIVLLSGSLAYADMRLAAGLGANHYFEKFPSADLIRRWIEAAEKSRRARRARRAPMSGSQLPEG